MNNTIIQQGSFFSNGKSRDITIRSDVDWMKTYNITQAATTKTPGRGCEFYWQRGMASDSGFMWTKQDGSNAIDMEVITSGGFILLNTSDQTPLALNTTGTAVTQANPAVVSCTSTAGLVNGDIVRMINVVNMQQISGVEFEIAGIVANTSFQLVSLNSSGFAAAGTTCSFRKIPNDPQYLPARRIINSITKANPCVIDTVIAHRYSDGDIVRVNIPAAFGMQELNGLTAEIIGVTDYALAINIDSSAFTAFSWPTSGTVPITHAHVVPVGTNSPTDLSAATDNTSYIGMKIAGGADSPAGSSGDTIYWVAGKSFSA